MHVAVSSRCDVLQFKLVAFSYGDTHFILVQNVVQIMCSKSLIASVGCATFTPACRVCGGIGNGYLHTGVALELAYLAIGAAAAGDDAVVSV